MLSGGNGDWVQQAAAGEASAAQAQVQDGKDSLPARSSRYRGVTKHRRSGR